MSAAMSRRPRDVAAAKDFLIRQRNRSDDRMPRYAEVAAMYGGVARAVAPVLNKIAADCAEAGEPDLSALVVLDSTGLPGSLHGEPLDPTDAGARAAWLNELDRIRRYPWPTA